MATPKPSRPWWKDVICYQIWPMSFKDSNSDGVGDIPGIISKLDYLQDLGIDVIWVSPTYASPLKDYGYDISDWQGVCPQFGTMEGMEELIEQVHQRGMKILLDLVITHTSSEHNWFKESKASRDNAKKDWYIWRDARKGDKRVYNNVSKTYDEVDEPTNWRACFGGSAWTYAPERNQYYLHLFMPAEPDLNWEKPEIRKAIYNEAIGFWLDKGVDGFRIDTVNRISKDWNFPDAEIKLEGKIQPASNHYINGPRSHEFLKEMRQYIEEHPSVKNSGQPVMLVGELPRTEYNEVLQYTHPDSKELSMVFDFDMVKLGGHDNPDEVKAHQVKNLCDGDPSFTLPLFKQRLKKVQDLIASGAWGTVFMENHDQCRSVTRYATPNPRYYHRAAKLLCLLQSCLSGTQFVYQGQEIGMTNVPEYWTVDDFRDPGAKNYINSEYEFYKKRFGEVVGRHAREQARKGDLKFGRDNGRTLIQWTGGKNAGFSDAEDGECWIGYNQNCHQGINVEDQQADKYSIWHFWKRCISMRKEYREILIHGSFQTLEESNTKTFTFLKTAADGTRALVVLNFSDEEEKMSMPGGKLKYLAGNRGDPEDPGELLAPWEGRIYLLEEA